MTVVCGFRMKYAELVVVYVGVMSYFWSVFMKNMILFRRLTLQI